jgi:hypothetical protein
MQSLTELALARSPTGVFTRVEVAAWVGGTADAEAALVKRALAAGEVIRICRGLYCLGSRYRDRPVDSLIVAQMIMGRYTRFFAGQSRTTRNVGLLEEFIRDLTTITTELEGLKARGADVTADLERIQQTLSVYRQETGAIRSARGDDSLPSQAQRLAGLANDQFERYRQLFANQSRVSRHPQTLESMIHTLKEVHAQMLALRTRGVSGGSHAKNISIVGERIESWETELRTIRDVVARAPVTERVGRLGEAANAIFAAYREEFAGKDRRSRDKARLGVIIEQLWPIFRSMDAIDRLDGDDTNARNLSIVTDQLRIYDREYTAIAQAQAPAKA